MYHNTLISKDHPQQAELEKVIALILAFSIVKSVYFSPHLEEDFNAGIVLVIIGDYSPHPWDELNDNYWKVFEDFPQFSFRIFDADWVKNELKDGNPFFTMHCNSNNLVYSTPESNEFDYAERLKRKRFLTKAKCRYHSEAHAAFILGVNVKFYVRGKDYLQAAYILHQNIRWLLVAASRFLTGEWLVAHELEIQQKHVGRYSKALANSFDAENAAEGKLLEVLNAACYTVQNGHDAPEITLELIKAAEVKKESIRMEVDRLFKECIGRCQYEFSRSKSPLIVVDEGNPLKMVTHIITNAVDVSALYCFGEQQFSRSASGCVLDAQGVQFQTTHYYLFLIVKDYQADVAGNLSYLIKEQTHGRCTATVVMHSKKSLRQKEGDQQYFFYQIMERAPLLFKEHVKPPYLPFDKAPARNYHWAKIYLNQRIRTASFLQEAEGLDGSGATKIHVYLMHLVLEQTCLGLIRLFLGYTPHQYSLQFLFELCEYFTPLTAEIFPRESDKDKELLKVLSGVINSLRHGHIDDVPSHDYEVLSNRYNEFVDRSDKIIARELERIEGLGNGDCNDNCNINDKDNFNGNDKGNENVSGTGSENVNDQCNGKGRENEYGKNENK